MQLPNKTNVSDVHQSVNMYQSSYTSRLPWVRCPWRQQGDLPSQWTSSRLVNYNIPKLTSSHANGIYHMLFMACQPCSQAKLHKYLSQRKHKRIKKKLEFYNIMFNFFCFLLYCDNFSKHENAKMIVYLYRVFLPEVPQHLLGNKTYQREDNLGQPERFLGMTEAKMNEWRGRAHAISASKRKSQHRSFSLVLSCLD